MFGLDGQRRTGVGDSGIDFGAVADDTGIGSEPFAVSVGVCGNRCDVEIVERGAVSFAAVQDGSP